MASQSIVAVSPDGRCIAAQVHQMYCVVDSNTGASVSLPAPVFSRVADGEGEGEGEDGEDGAEDGADDGGDASSKPAAAKKSKQDKAAAAAAAATGKGQRSHEGPKPVRVLAFHPDAAQPWLVFNTEEKYLHMYHRHSSYASGFKHIITLVIPRKVQSAVFHTGFSPSSTQFEPNADGTASAVALQLPHLLVADKTGDVFSLSGADLATQKMELGHLANITHIEFFRAPAAAAAGRNYFLSSDSDGKIRVSKSPNYFDIQSFCLGHQALVSTFVVLPLSKPVIVSGGLGAELILWDLATGRELSRFDLNAHKPADAAAAASSSSAAPAATPATAGADQTYISSIQLAKNPSAAADSPLQLAVSVYPWSSILFLSYSPAAASTPLAVTSVVATDSTPMCMELAPALASAAAAFATPRLFYVNQALEVRSLRQGAECGQWKDATTTGPAAAQALAKTTLASLDAAFEPARASRGESLITEANAHDFVGSGTDQPKNEAQTEAQAARAAAAAAAGHSGRYISPFSSLHSNHLMRLSLLSAAGFAFRRFFDKLQRDKYVSGKRAEAAVRKTENKKKRVENKKANKRQKKEDKEKEEKEEEAAAME